MQIGDPPDIHTYRECVFENGIAEKKGGREIEKERREREGGREGGERARERGRERDPESDGHIHTYTCKQTPLALFKFSIHRLPLLLRTYTHFSMCHMYTARSAEDGT